MNTDSPIGKKMPLKKDGAYLLSTTPGERGKWYNFVEVSSGVIVRWGSLPDMGKLELPLNPPLEFRALADQLRLIESVNPHSRHR